MQGDTIIFFPKYTTLSGALGGSGYQYYSDPYDVTRFNQIDVELFTAAISGTTPGYSAQLQESSDLETWTSIGTVMTPAAANTRSADSVSNTLRYVRLMIDGWGSTDGQATIWAKGVARNT